MLEERESGWKVDKEVRGLLELGPVRERLGFDPLVLSKNIMDGLLDFLDAWKPVPDVFEADEMLRKRVILDSRPWTV